MAPNPAFRSAGQGDTIAVRGFTQLQAVLRRLEDETQGELRKKIRAIGDRVALVAASNAPRRTGELQHSIRSTANSRGASVYSTAIYGGAINFGAWTGDGRGPHIKRADASHYMDRAVTGTAPWVEQQITEALDWVLSTFEEGS